jgi:hypothetical protein
VKGGNETKANWWDAGPLLPHLHVSENVPHDTGLLDARGNKIIRTPLPVGFGRHDEWKGR